MRVEQRRGSIPRSLCCICRNFVYAIGYTHAYGGKLLFDWDDANIDHIAEHGVTPEEAEAALLDPDRVSRSAYSVSGERRYALLGAAEDGRRLFVVFTRRRDAIRVISVRDATGAEKRVYEKRRK